MMTGNIFINEFLLIDAKNTFFFTDELATLDSIQKISELELSAYEWDF